VYKTKFIGVYFTFFDGLLGVDGKVRVVKHHLVEVLLQKVRHIRVSVAVINAKERSFRMSFKGSLENRLDKSVYQVTVQISYSVFHVSSVALSHGYVVEFFFFVEIVISCGIFADKLAIIERVWTSVTALGRT